MKTKIMFAIFSLIIIKSFAQDSSLTSPVDIDGINKNNSHTMEQRRILYNGILNDEINYVTVNTQKNFMRACNKPHMTIDTNLVAPKKHSVWKSAGIGMITGLVAGAILGAVTANPDDIFYGYTAAEGAIAFGALGAAFGGVSGLIVGVIQNVASKKSH